jgi:hypothetical protein
MQKQIWAVRFFPDRERRSGPEIRTCGIVVQQKTGRSVQFEITSDVRASLLAWLERCGGEVKD